MDESKRSRLRVLDLTDDLAPSAGRTMVGLGADVVRLELADEALTPPATRLHWHAGKRFVIAATRAELREIVDELAPQADIVIESGPTDVLAGIQAGRELTSRWPDVVHVVVTPFGLTGPRRHWQADDLVLASAGGMTWLGGRPDGQPKPPPREQAVQLAGAHAAIAALLGLIIRDRTGTGQLIDISAQEAVAATLETSAIAWIHGQRYPSRTGGVYEHVAHRIFAAADGYVAGGYSGSPRMWTDLLAWLVEEGAEADLNDSAWANPVHRWQERPHVDDVLAGFVARRPARDIATEARRRALPWAEVVAAGQIRANPQLTDRRFFIDITGADGCTVQDTGFGFEAPALPKPVALQHPRPVQVDAAWTSRPPREHRKESSGTQPLDGVRVLDLTWVLAGPYATKTLADFGAEVVKIESIHRGDPTRSAPGMRLRPGAGVDDSGYFINFNRNKLSVALNLRTEEGQRLLRRLALASDIVIENFSPGTLARWGLTYEQLAAERPSIIVASMAGTGQTGPWREAVTFADTLAAMSGLAHETGDPGGPPQGLTFGLGDMVAANTVLIALLDRLLTGRGGTIDLSQLEAMAAALGPAVLETQLGAPTSPSTHDHPNRHPTSCPHGVYPTAGTDRWIAIAVRDDTEWRALTELCEPLRSDAALDQPGRRLREDCIDERLSAWTSAHNGDDLAWALQARGVPAAAVNNGRDLVECDEQLASREFYVPLVHPIAGRVLHEGIVERLSVGAGELRTPAPLLGEHTEQVLHRVLGIGPEEIADLQRGGVLE